MCTVTYIPHDSGCYLTSNRDETRTRNARDLAVETISNQHECFYPKDTQHGGTWLAASDRGHMVCILNGGFVPYDRSVVYSQSRGDIPKFMLEHHSIEKLKADFPLADTAPFTMVYFDGEQLHEVRYDGKGVHHQLMDPGSPHIWSSVTLYPEDVRKARRAHFSHFLSINPEPGPDALMEFHQGQPFGDGKNDFIMNRDGKVETVSITQVMIDERQVEMRHKDLIGGKMLDIKRKRTID